ncbi:MAG: GNAT family N-acetyltransferase [Anaerolineae bacterium]
MSISHISTLSDTITHRPFSGDEDWWRIRQLLIETTPITPIEWNWEIRRWDGWRYHNPDSNLTPEWSRRIHLWETASGKLVGVVHPEGKGDVFLELHPDYRSLQEEMFAWAEEHLSIEMQDMGTQIETFVWDYDAPRRRVLRHRGWEPAGWSGVVRRLRFGGQALPPVTVDKGYRLRTVHTADRDDCQRIAHLLNAAFGRSFHSAEEVYTFVTQSPSYRTDLDLVAEAPDGSLAALVGVTYDEINQRAIFEPVCTHPLHRRHGLARSLMFEGMHRARALGALEITVATGDDLAANELYDSIGFTEAYTGRGWKKLV